MVGKGLETLYKTLEKIFLIYPSRKDIIKVRVSGAAAPIYIIMGGLTAP